MRLATIRQSQEIDRCAQDEFGIPAEVLMEDAGAAAVRSIIEKYQPELKWGEVLVLCGSGHNGGDGLVVARLLAQEGYRVRVGLVFPKEKLAKLTLKQLDHLDRRTVPIDEFDETSVISEKTSLIVDGIFGIGLARAVTGTLQQIFEKINADKIPVVALDVPSGLNADTGEVMGSAIRADFTITFGFPKPGFFIRSGPEYTGHLRSDPISFPPEVLRREAGTVFLFEEKDARRNFPKLDPLANKTKRGRTYVVAGSRGKWGAAVLASRAASRAGSGYVVLASHEDPKDFVGQIPEVMTEELDLQVMNREASFAVGPGLGVNKETRAVIESLLNEGVSRVVLDADALTCLAQGGFGRLPPTWIWTPHTGELSRVLGVESSVIESDRIRFACEAQKKIGGILLLKGRHSLLVKDGRTLIIHAGNNALAKAGTGDVLTGLIGGLLAQGLDSARAAALGAFIHGRMGEMWVQAHLDRASLTASDLLMEIPVAMNQIRTGRR